MCIEIEPQLPNTEELRCGMRIRFYSTDLESSEGRFDEDWLSLGSDADFIRLLAV